MQDERTKMKKKGLYCIANSEALTNVMLFDANKVCCQINPEEY